MRVLIRLPTHMAASVSGCPSAVGNANEIVANRIDGNPVAGILLSNTEDIPALDNRIADNALTGNGVDVADVSAPRAPSEGNCFEYNTAATVSPESLMAAGCPEGNSPDEAGTVPTVSEPAGMSFLQVPPPPDQPALSDVETLPEPLPDAVNLPPESDYPVPDDTHLSDRAGTA